MIERTIRNRFDDVLGLDIIRAPRSAMLLASCEARYGLQDDLKILSYCGADQRMLNMDSRNLYTLPAPTTLRGNLKLDHFDFGEIVP